MSAVVPVPRMVRQRSPRVPTYVSRAVDIATCRRGHLQTLNNTYGRNGSDDTYRRCQICQYLRMRVGVQWVDVADAQGRVVRVSVAAHDAFYLTERARLKAALAASHTDRVATATTKAFMVARATYKAFETEQAAWYAWVGVPVPSRRARTARLRDGRAA